MGDIKFIPVRAARSIRIYVKPFGGVVVKYPARSSLSKAKNFLRTKHTWIKQARQRAQETERKSLAHHAQVPVIGKSEIRKELTNRLEALAEQYGFKYGKISLRNQSSRWGSCSTQNNISLNQKLFYVPDHLRDYVLVHELAHTQQKNHSASFWKIVFDIFGEQSTKQMRAELKNYDYLFYPPPPEMMGRSRFANKP